MTYTLSGGALDSTHTPSVSFGDCVGVRAVGPVWPARPGELRRHVCAYLQAGAGTHRLSLRVVQDCPAARTAATQTA